MFTVLLSLYIFEINYKMLNNTNEQAQMKTYTSCIKINGVPILSPIMTSERRAEMLHYKNLAVKVEENKQSKLNAKSVDKFSNSKMTDNLLEESFKSKQVPFSDEGEYQNVNSQLVLENISSKNSESANSPVDLTDLLPDNSYQLVPLKNKPELLHMTTENQVPSVENKLNINLCIHEQIDSQCISYQNETLHDNFVGKTNSTLSRKKFCIAENKEKFSCNDVLSEVVNNIPNINNEEKIISSNVKIISSKEDYVEILPIKEDAKCIQNLKYGAITKNKEDETIVIEDTNLTCQTKTLRSNPPLIRQNSYTLDSPSPILLAMIENQLKANNAIDSPEKIQYSNQEQRKRSCWDLEKAKEKWSSLESISVCIANNSSKISIKNQEKSKTDSTSSNYLSPITKKNEISKSAESISQIKDKKGKPAKFISNISKNKSVLKPSITKYSTFQKCKDVKKKPKSSELLTQETDQSNLTCHEYLNEICNSSPRDVQILKIQNFFDGRALVKDKIEEHFQNDNKILKLKNILDESIPQKNLSSFQSSNFSNTVSKESIQKLFFKIQIQHSNQMAELVETQKKEQEKLIQIFKEQQFFLMKQIQSYFPEMFDILKKNKLNEMDYSSQVNTQHITSTDINDVSINSNFSDELYVYDNSDKQNENQSNCDNFKYQYSYDYYDKNHIGNSTISNEGCNQIYHDINAVSSLNQTITSHLFENGTHRSVYTDSLNSTDSPVFKNSLNEDIDTTSDITITQEMSSKNNDDKEHIFLNLNAIDSPSQIKSFDVQEMNQIDYQKLFSSIFYRKKYNAKEIKATIILQAATRGFLIRRLMRTERVQTLIKTVKDTLLCALELHHEDLGEIKAPDIELHRRLIQQLTSACYSLHDLFFTTTIQEKMSIISLDRKRLQNQLSRSSSARSTPSLSTTTRKVIQRKQQQSMHSRSNVIPASHKCKQSLITDLQKRTPQKPASSWLGSSHHSSAPSTPNVCANKKPWR